MIKIPQGIDLMNAKFQLDDWLGSVTMTGYTPGSPPRYGDGNIRIWTKDGDQPRSANGLNLGSNLVIPYTDDMYYTAAQLGFTDTNRVITLYVEGHSLSSSLVSLPAITSLSHWQKIR